MAKTEDTSQYINNREHKKFNDGVGAKRVIPFFDNGDGTYSDSTQIATEETLQSVAGFNIPEHDEIAMTYVTAGNGVGEIETVVYKLATVTQATLTLSYDSNNKLNGVVKS